MGSINSFGNAVQEILLNKFFPTFWNCIKGKSSQKITLNTNISRTAYDRKINEPILKSSHLKVVRGF